MTGRALLEGISDAVAAVRELRYTPPEAFADVEADDLARCARGLRAISYSARLGAEALERIVATR